MTTNITALTIRINILEEYYAQYTKMPSAVLLNYSITLHTYLNFSTLVLPPEKNVVKVHDWSVRFLKNINFDVGSIVEIQY